MQKQLYVILLNTSLYHCQCSIRHEIQVQGDVDSRHGSFYAVQSQKKEACNMVRILVVEDDEKLNHVCGMPLSGKQRF